ncbi:hypothetical protein BCR44DRAFT_1432719 [Catenaria anguillulae PL171]|uniref:Ras-GEF domain-containing protein n=1 Tax=Catenaria anguillulae PL171 TaxID=765915 RepID=A0A1Y2HPK7_9FUNG|nr:hypothetical protein BCR44DRAFT_1432719 [Catenaria anguillulae PL171]
MEHEGWRYPFVPFFGLFLKDLMFWNENAKLNDAGQINFSKLRSIARLVQDLRRWQQHDYVPSPGLVVQQSGNSQPSSPSTMSSSLIPASAIPSSSGASSQSHGVPELVEKYCKNLRALKEQNIYKYSCLCERKAGTGAGDSVRLIEKWASQTTGDKVSGKGR